jgi:hypothetical protein
MRGQRLVWLLLAVGAFIVLYGNSDRFSLRGAAGSLATPEALSPAAFATAVPETQGAS